MFRIRSRLLSPFALLVSIAATAAAAAEPKTAAEGMLRAGAEGVKANAALIQAHASMVTARGQAAKAVADTRKALEECRGLAIDNDVKATKAFYDKRTSRHEYLTAHARPRPTAEDIARYTKASLPKRLDKVLVNPVAFTVGGQIPWPAVFNQPEFEPWRTQIEEAFQQRCMENCGVGSPLYQQVHHVTCQMARQLKSQIRQLPPMQYMAAKRFLESLAYETHFPPGDAQVAAAR